MACRGSVVAMAIATTDFTVFDVDLSPFWCWAPLEEYPITVAPPKTVDPRISIRYVAL
jgi:hypothetical protein